MLVRRALIDRKRTERYPSQQRHRHGDGQAEQGHERCDGHLSGHQGCIQAQHTQHAQVFVKTLHSHRAPGAQQSEATVLQKGIEWHHQNAPNHPHKGQHQYGQPQHRHLGHDRHHQAQ